ncbi:ABC transporter, transmembrane domain, type 1 [Cordyceps fumosorosea ARSEF 2679]|uniref:ABC transporter, transmembrane domain, type 1 n=1 Tax=Cordyceps fumosorosea (strain ARSEF 2679) TaxID=1081104 RepID=A0A167SZB7_CORFA|nr:ABC transporter, transmembrane domain, type 1 [Cordyceps fumosorosea ARSEF 2679]OAA60085.1 ABC transporter, transmembrane domain, type 1 [Cordyceps fumosorosea ARSEF 2679]
MAYASHAHFVQPILFLAGYLSMTLLFDLVTIHTYFHRTGLGTVARLTCSLPALKLTLLILEEISKRTLIIAENPHPLSREATAGFWSRSTFLWINPLLLFGFRHVINPDDLPDIGQQFDSKKLYQNLKKSWDKRDQRSRYALLRALVISMPWPFLYVIPPRLFLVGFVFSQPFLLQDVVNAASGESIQPDYISKQNEAIGLILATALVFCGKAVSRNWFSHIRNQIMTCVRGALIAAIYQKSLRISAAESDESAAVTLITADVAGIERLISLSYDSCAMTLEVGFGIAILAVFVGTASIFTVVTAIVVTVFSRHMSKRMGVARKRWNEHIEERVAATSNILAQIKDIKMTGLAPSMATHLNHLRAQEVTASLADRRIVCITFGISAFAETVTPALVVAATLFWTRASGTISTARFYTILAVVTLVAQPLASFFASLPQWSAGFACLSRIQVYLAQEELKDARQIIRSSAVAGSNLAGDGIGLDDRNPDAHAQNYAIELRNVNVSMDLTGSILRDATILVKTSQVTMIDGSVGSGKSTLLKVMLGEMLLRNGSALLSSSSIAYAGEKPWLLNTTIFLNIIGHKPFDRTLYQRVIFICDLKPDLEQLPDGDETIVGSGGCILSGGQRQRISLARALYLEADITILDDPFSSLDQETSAVIRIRLISDGNATLDGRTLVMTTSMKQHLIDADAAYRVTPDGHVVYLPQSQVDRELEELAQSSRSQPTSATHKTESACDLFEPPAVQAATDDNGYAPGINTFTKQSTWCLYAYFFRPAGIFVLAAWLLFTTLASVSEKLPNIFVRIWLEADAGNKTYYVGYATLCVAYPILNSVSAMFFFYFVSAKTAHSLHERLVKATFTATFGFLTTEDASSILNRFSQDMSMATQRVPALVMPTLFRAVSIFVDTGIISAGASYAAPVIPFFLMLIIAIQRYYLCTSRQLRVLELDSSKALIRHFTETAAGIEHIRAFRWQEEVTRDFHWLEGVLDLSSAVAAVIVVTFALKFSGSASGNSMGLALLSLIGFSDTVSDWVQSSVALETALGAVSRIRSYCAETPTEHYKDDTEPVSSDWPVQGQLELNCVSAIYRGKTTVLLSILNLLQYKGTISIDNREIRTIHPDFLRSRITTITQGGIHLRGSIKFNLDPFGFEQRPPTCIVTDEACQDVLRRVGLWDIVSRRGNLSSLMKEMNFSQGQRQLFQIARAILHHEATGSRIVLMDEVTSSLDEDTEAQMIIRMLSWF